MENYIVSARKYRPTTFDSVVGQRALTTTLKNVHASLPKPSTAFLHLPMVKHATNANHALPSTNNGHTIYTNWMQHPTTRWKTSAP